MDYIYNLKGFLSKERLGEYDYDNLVFESVPFSIGTLNCVKDVHEVSCILKIKGQEELPLKKESLTIIKGEIKLTLIISIEEKAETILASTIETFIFKVHGQVENLYPLDIYFTVQGDKIFGKLLLVGFKLEEMEYKNNEKENILRELFL
ncbi:MAG: hypothetical protein ACRC7N_10500 [Clostridium sp.]